MGILPMNLTPSIIPTINMGIRVHLICATVSLKLQNLCQLLKSINLLEKISADHNPSSKSNYSFSTASPKCVEVCETKFLSVAQSKKHKSQSRSTEVRLPQWRGGSDGRRCSDWRSNGGGGRNCAGDGEASAVDSDRTAIGLESFRFRLGGSRKLTSRRERVAGRSGLFQWSTGGRRRTKDGLS
ncbi:hypothetical protein VNO78_30449 [Psophocarpus tetragonolobus]|uniref:Uncharacterized protein n=1 Tax=Psophocarpus tetragonolobus TaxID=3891 RepID=A0AAN9X4R0_PSOTE